MQEQLKNMEELDLVDMAGDLYGTVKKSYAPFKGKKFTKDTSKYANTLISAFNALRGSYSIKLKHFHLNNVQEKVEAVKERNLKQKLVK